MRIFAFNPNVGSAIEYMGDIIVSWLEEIGEVHDCKHQTRTSHYVKFLMDYKPDVIVTNEFYVRAMIAANIYKYLTGVPFIHVDHVWSRLNSTSKDREEGLLDGTGTQEYEALRECRQLADWIFCTNYMPEYETWHHRIAPKVSNRYYATDPAVFNVQKPWSERTKMFGYFGNIVPHKLSGDFLAKIQHTDLVLDCYGSRLDNFRDMQHRSGYDRYYITFDRIVESGNVNYYGLIDQHKIAEVMNEYKYFVMPHHGYEPFNWVLKQCMHCGTIPLLTNDRHSTLYNGKWIDWAEGLYMSCVHTDEFISNLEQLEDEQPDHSGLSEYLSQEVRRRFPYQEFKNEFQQKVEELLHGETYYMEQRKRVFQA